MTPPSRDPWRRVLYPPLKNASLPVGAGSGLLGTARTPRASRRVPRLLGPRMISVKVVVAGFEAIETPDNVLTLLLLTMYGRSRLDVCRSVFVNKYPSSIRGTSCPCPCMSRYSPKPNSLEIVSFAASMKPWYSDQAFSAKELPWAAAGA